MKTVLIKTTNPYKVLIGKNLLESCGEYISEVVTPGKAALITDKTVDSLYADTVTDSLEKAGFATVKYTFCAGEASKNIETYTNILEFLANNKITRSDIIIALGGGVTGDMAGFAAATYLRGIKYIGIPTTLLAAVDSSVGGKTAVNLNAGKNLVGAFHQPSLVICDTDTLKTLSDKYMKDGISETVKYGIISDKELFETMKTDYINKLDDIIERCVSIKNEIVSEDVFDTGKRQLLNLGHTFGHSIEKLSNFEISHGHAVAIGMVMAAKVSEAIGIAEKGTADETENILRILGLPTKTEFTAEEIVGISLNDKKRTGDTITFVLPEKIGKTILKKIKTEELYNFAEKGLN